jgi:hypothetical protein
MMNEVRFGRLARDKRELKLLPQHYNFQRHKSDFHASGDQCVSG